MALTLTQRAAQELKRMIVDQKRPEATVLRIGVAGGGCSGFEYQMDFDGAADEEQDHVSESHGIQIAVDRKSSKLLDGTQIDFHEDLLSRNFVFNNPLATKTCGCGTSFQV